VHQGNRCRLPIKGEWETVEEDEIEELLNLSARTVLFSSMVITAMETNCNVLPYQGGYLNQPRFFWSLYNMYNHVKNKYQELEIESRDNP
jgi:hypothetical protein